MVDDMSPKLANAHAKQMAQKMKDDQTNEIARLEPKTKYSSVRRRKKRSHIRGCPFSFA